MKKKRGRIPSGKGVSYARCKDCSVKYKGIIRNAEGKIERRISCQTNCLFLKARLVTHI
jgi:hypothetical protein